MPLFRLIAATVCAMACSPALAQGSSYWVVVGYVDHEPMAWADSVTTKAAELENRLAACGLRPFWDWTAKFDGFNPNGRGTVFVIDGSDRPKAQAEALAALARPCIPDAYVKAARYLGE